GDTGPKGQAGLKDFILILDQRPSGTMPDTFTMANDRQWRTRTLNTIKFDSSGNVLSLTHNEVELAEGSYRCEANIITYSANGGWVTARLFNVTEQQTLGLSPRDTATNSKRAQVIAYFTLNSISKVRIDQFYEVSQNETRYNGAAIPANS